MEDVSISNISPGAITTLGNIGKDVARSIIQGLQKNYDADTDPQSLVLKSIEKALKGNEKLLQSIADKQGILVAEFRRVGTKKVTEPLVNSVIGRAEPMKKPAAKENTKNFKQDIIDALLKYEDEKRERELGGDAPEFVLAGVTEAFLRQMREKLPHVLEKINFGDKKEPKKGEALNVVAGGQKGGLIDAILKNVGDAGKAIGAALLSGLLTAALGTLATALTMYGLKTSGPEKGLIKDVAWAAWVAFTKSAKSFGARIVKLVMAPIELGKKFISKIGKLLPDFVKTMFTGGAEKAAGEVITKVLPKGGFLKTITKGILGVIGKSAKILTKIPIIGTILSWGFAISRGLKGDWVGATIDFLSGLAGLLALTGVGEAVALPLQLGLDALNMFLDYKAGGSSKEANAKKLDLIGGFITTAGKWITEAVIKMPVIGNMIKGIQLLIAGNFKDALPELIKGTPILGYLLAIVPESNNIAQNASAAAVNAGVKAFDFVKITIDWITKTVMDLPVIGDLLKAIQSGDATAVMKSMGKFIPGWDTITNMTSGAMTGIGAAATGTGNMFKGIWKDQVKPFIDKATAPIPTGQAEQIKNQEKITPTVTPTAETASPESKLMSSKVIDPLLNSISDNTKSTSESIVVLTEVMVKLAETLGMKIENISVGDTNIVNNSSSDKEPPLTLAQRAARSTSVIHEVRNQFRLA